MWTAGDCPQRKLSDFVECEAECSAKALQRVFVTRARPVTELSTVLMALPGKMLV